MSRKSTGDILNKVFDPDAQALRITPQGVLPHVSGRYYTNFLQKDAPTTEAFSEDVIRAIPIVIPNSGTYDRVGIYTTTTGSGGHYGIYTDNNGVPGELLYNQEEDFSASGSRIETIDWDLPAGIYWLAKLLEAAVTCRSITAGNNSWLLGTPDAASQEYTHVTKAQAYGALPSTFGTATPSVGEAPQLVIRRA